MQCGQMMPCSSLPQTWQVGTSTSSRAGLSDSSLAIACCSSCEDKPRMAFAAIIWGETFSAWTGLNWTACCSSSAIVETLLGRPGRDLGAVVQVQFVADVLEVIRHRPRPDRQLGRDLTVGQAVGHKPG